jgi:starch-binding outer membrane protein, SusD/RagB family
MSEVRRERAVELSFEGHRFTDLRRWLLLTQSSYSIKTSQEFERVGELDLENPQNNRVANFREKVILQRQLSDKHYWIPLRTSDVIIYEGFHQNPGW